MATITGTNASDPEREGTKLADRVVWRRGAVQTIKRESPSQRKTPMKLKLLTAASIVCAVSTPHAATGDQIIVRDLVTSKGSTSVVPMNLNGDSLTDLLSYNATTGRAVYSIGANPPGTQGTVREPDQLPKGWTALVPMNLNGDGRTDLLWYNAKTGRAVYSIAAEIPGAQVVVRDLMRRQGLDVRSSR